MSDNSARIASAVLGILVALGLAVAGYFVSTTLYKARLASNTVTVKGFAERDVKADLALWEISYSITGGNLADLYAQSSRNQATITALLTGKGFRPVDIKPAGLEINDLLANQYRSNNVPDSQRYILKNTLTVRSVDVERVEATTQSLNDLIRQGIVLTGNNVDYQFTKLNDIKAPMLKDATQNARDAAQQFANDAGSRVGSIQSASQGLFSINSRDSSAAQNPDGGPSYSAQKSTIDKRVRVVVTLTYYLDR
jgi:hypothetical protein